jgi:UDP-N-acetylmuramate--alanine ligase
VYDDYAHHPTAVQATIAGVREKFPGKKIVIAFHPHLYSRTKDLFNEFVSALATADQIFLAPIYAAREVDDGTVSSERLAEAISKTNPNVVALPDFDAVRDALQKIESDSIILTMGAGDIYKVAEKIST